MIKDGYTLSRTFWDFAFENPEKISPNHAAIFFFAIEHCNRLGWKEKFGLPSQMVMDAIGVKKHSTYIRYFRDLIDWGFFKLIQKSSNQYSANIICLNNALPKKGEALDKAIMNHAAKHTAKHTAKQKEYNKTTKQLNQQNKKVNQKENSDSSEKPKIIELADAVKMPEHFYQKLISDFGPEKTERAIQKLNAYKLSTGKKYKSDYHTILNWVMDEVSKDQQKQKRQLAL